MATVALLKVNFDSGRDHIAMFEPFIVDAVSGFGADGFDLEAMRTAMVQRHRLSIPAHTLRTLMTRVVRRGFVRREGGRYFPTKKERRDLVEQRLQVEARQRRLAESLREFAGEHRFPLTTTDDALAAILGFFEDYHVPLVLDERFPNAQNAASDELGRRTLLVAAFLQGVLERGGELVEIVQEMLEGFILQNALLLKDISTAARRFKDLDVFLDSGLVLGALGLRGEAIEIATKEAFSLIRESGASLSVFEATIREVRTILAIYEERLATTDGRLSLRPTDVTRYFLTKRYSPSDVRTQSALVERNLVNLGINIREIPIHDARYTLGEADLSIRLADRAGGEHDPRVVHDVNCIAGVLTLRGDRRSPSFDDARAVFATTSVMTVRTASEWYEAQGAGGVPPIVDHFTLSNLAWLKRPASASKLKLHELVALCSAALRPQRSTWDLFLGRLKSLRASGELSSDEVTAIVASQLTDRVLVEETLDDEVDASTISEVIERVRASYRSDADARISKAEVIARESERQALDLRMRVEGRARALAKRAIWLATGLLALAMLSGFGVTVYSMWNGNAPGMVGWVLGSAFGLAGLLSVLWGFNLNGWRQVREEQLARWLKRWLGASVE